MKLFNKYSKLFSFVLITTISCTKDKNPFPIFPKKEGTELTNPVSLPFHDSLNYGSSVASFGIPPGWLEAYVGGSKDDRGWAYRSNFGLTSTATDGAIIASAFGGNAGTDNVYLIVGPFTLGSTSSVQLSCDIRYEYSTDPGSLKFKYSTNYSGSGDPEASDVIWTEVNELNSILPTVSSSYKNIKSSFTLPDKVFIGIHYSGGNNLHSSRWRIDNFSLKKN